MIRFWLGALGLSMIVGCGARTDLDQPFASGVVGGGGEGARACVDEDIAHDEAGASGLAVDGDVVFWVTNDGHLMRHDASGNTQLASDYYAKQIALDATYVYGVSNSALTAIPRSGGDGVTLAHVAGEPVVVFDDVIYVATYSADLGGSVVAVHAPGQAPNPVTIIDGLSGAEGLAVDATRVYVTATSARVGSQIVDHPVLAADRTRAASEQTPTVLATTAGWSFSLAVDDGYVYYPDAGSIDGWFVFAVPKSGGAPLAVIDGSTIGETPLAVAVDSSGVWAITSIDPALYEIRRGGIGLQGPAPTIVDGDLDESFASIRTTTDAVYWTIQWGPNFEKPRAGVSLRKKCK